jgi:ankyrin repeat protein
MNKIDEYITKTNPADVAHLVAFGGEESYDFWKSLFCILELHERKEFLEKKDYKDWTPLHMAVVGERCNVVKDLLDLGSEINAVDNQGFSSLHFSVSCGLEEITTLLIDRGANINMKAQDGETPLSMAKERKNENIISLLISRGAHPIE